MFLTVLDKIYVNDTSYGAVKVVTPTVRSDHKAVIAYTGAPPRQLNKTREQTSLPVTACSISTARTSRNL